MYLFKRRKGDGWGRHLSASVRWCVMHPNTLYTWILSYIRSLLVYFDCRLREIQKGSPDCVTEIWRTCGGSLWDFWRVVDRGNFKWLIDWRPMESSLSVCAIAPETPESLDICVLHWCCLHKLDTSCRQYYVVIKQTGPVLFVIKQQLTRPTACAHAS